MSNAIEPPISEILKIEMLNGEQKKKEDLLERELEIIDYIIRKGDYGFYAIVQAKQDEKNITFIVGRFMLNQLKQVKKDKFPLKVKLSKHENYIRFERHQNG